MNPRFKPRVLCVDDEPAVLRALAALLRDRCEVWTTSDANEALQQVVEHEFDVVISDQRMPGMTGTEFLARVKALTPHSMRLLLTGCEDPHGALASVNDSEVFRFIQKPWDNQRLLETVTYAATVARGVPLQRPAHPPAQPGPVALTGAHARAGSDLRTVLLMDSDPVTEQQLRASLGHGTLLLWARNPGEAIRLTHRHKVAVIVTDTRLGDSVTLELIRTVKRGSPNAVAVVHAAEHGSRSVSRLINEGQVFRFMTQPASPDLMARTLAEALNKHSELMAQPASVARHALDVARQDVSATSPRACPHATDSLALGWVEQPPGAWLSTIDRSAAPLPGLTWLKRLLRWT